MTEIIHLAKEIINHEARWTIENGSEPIKCNLKQCTCSCLKNKTGQPPRIITGMKELQSNKREFNGNDNCLLWNQIQEEETGNIQTNLILKSVQTKRLILIQGCKGKCKLWGNSFTSSSDTVQKLESIGLIVRPSLPSFLPSFLPPFLPSFLPPSLLSSFPPSLPCSSLSPPLPSFFLFYPRPRACLLILERGEGRERERERNIHRLSF